MEVHKMDFVKAIKVMENGIICESDGDLQYRIYHHKLQFNNDGIWQDSMTILLRHSEADWLIVEEKKTLSDQIAFTSVLGEAVPVVDVRTAIKTIKEEIEKKIKNQVLGTSDKYIGGLNYAVSIIDEVIGDKLVKG